MRWETKAAIVLGLLAVLTVFVALALDWWDDRQLRREERAEEDADRELDDWLASLSEPDEPRLAWPAGTVERAMQDGPL